MKTDYSIETIKSKLAELNVKNAELARIIGDKTSGQLIGMYLSGKRKPKRDFWDKWERAFNEIETMKATTKETNVSNGTKNKMESNNDSEEIYKNIVEGHTEYILIPRSVLQEKYRLVAIEQLNQAEAELLRKQEQIHGLYKIIEQMNTNIMNMTEKISIK